MEKTKRNHDFDDPAYYRMLYRRWRAAALVLLTLVIIAAGFAYHVLGLLAVKVLEDARCCYGG